MKSVFISSTSKDLQDHRTAVDKAIRRLRLRPINMDDFGAQHGGAVEVSLREVRQSDIFVGILAHRYGYVPEDMEKSVTEQEYDEAVQKGIPRLMYLVDENYDWPDEHIEADELAQKGLKAFKDRVNATEVRSLFTTPDQLAQQVTADLTKLLDKQRSQRLIQGVLGLIAIIIIVFGLIVVTNPNTSPLNLIPTPLEAETVAEGEIAVVVAQFEGEYPEAQIDVRDVLRRAAEEVGNVQIITIGHPIEDREQAQEIGELYGATMVVYGRVARGGVTTHYEILNENIPTQVEGDFRVSVGQVENIDLFMYEGMDANYILGLSLGQLYLFDERYEDAIKAFELAENSLDIERSNELDAHILFFYLGNSHFYLSQYEQAIFAFNNSIEIEPVAITYNNRGNAYMALENYDNAIIDYDNAIELDPESILAYHNRGAIYSSLNEFELALNQFSYAIELDPTYSNSYMMRATLHIELGEYELGFADFAKAIDLDPKHIGVYYNRGVIYYALKDYNNAIADFNQLIELAPNLADAYHYRGIAYHDLGEYELALADFDRAIDVNPRFYPTFYDRGVLYYELREYEKSIADFDLLIELTETAPVYNNRGNAYRDLGNYEQAFMDYAQAIALEPEYALAYHNRGFAYYLLHEYSRAIADYNRVIELEPYNALAHANRGRVNTLLSNYQAALNDFVKYEELTGEPLPDWAVEYREEAQAALGGE